MTSQPRGHRREGSGNNGSGRCSIKGALTFLAGMLVVLAVNNMRTYQDSLVARRTAAGVEGGAAKDGVPSGHMLTVDQARPMKGDGKSIPGEPKTDPPAGKEDKKHHEAKGQEGERKDTLKAADDMTNKDKEDQGPPAAAGHLRKEAPPLPGTRDIGSQVDLESAYRRAKEKMRLEREGGQQAAEQPPPEPEKEASPPEAVVAVEEEKKEGLEREGGQRDQQQPPPEEEQKKEEPPAPKDEDDEESSGVSPPEYMPTRVTERPPITEDMPPLHRKKEEVAIEKILFMMSSTDRGQRIGTWDGDKLETILVIMDTFRVLCERGFDVTVWYVAAWKTSEFDAKIKESLYCQRIEGPVDVQYWDHFPADIGGELSHKHRYVVKENIDKYDFFISGEDDILITPRMFDAFMDASFRLANAEDPNKYFPGFARKEHDNQRDGRWSLWETDKHDYNVTNIPGAGYFAEVHGNTHQAMWMATREQLHHFDKRCDEGFFNIKPGPWVEFWSGALQLWDYCKGLKKVIPMDTFREFTVWHMTDTKLHLRGKKPPDADEVEEIIAKLEEEKAKNDAVA